MVLSDCGSVALHLFAPYRARLETVFEWDAPQWAFPANLASNVCDLRALRSLKWKLPPAAVVVWLVRRPSRYSETSLPPVRHTAVLLALSVPKSRVRELLPSVRCVALLWLEGRGAVQLTTIGPFWLLTSQVPLAFVSTHESTPVC